MICPICNEKFNDYPAILRIDNKTMICSTCGSREAVYDALFFKPKEIEKTSMKVYNEEKFKFLKTFMKGEN